MARGLNGKVAIVTGAAGGIGRETAVRLAEEGVRVVVADRDVDGVNEAAESLGDAGLAVGFDAMDADSIERVVEAAVSGFGRLDILHNNVAMTSEAWGTDQDLRELSLEVWDRTYAINVRSHFVATKAALPHLLENGGGSIVNMASIAALRGSAALTAYGSSKGAVVAFTRYVAAQFGKQGVRANCVAPGVIGTQQVHDNAPGLAEQTLATLPYHRIGEATDVASLVTFLASDESSFINGQTIVCDGGGTSGSAAPR